MKNPPNLNLEVKRKGNLERILRSCKQSSLTELIAYFEYSSIRQVCFLLSFS